MIGAPSAPTILVVSATGDPATPYDMGEWMVKALGNARLLTRDGPGHLAFGADSACIDDFVVGFFSTGTLPPEGAMCKV